MTNFISKTSRIETYRVDQYPASLAPKEQPGKKTAWDVAKCVLRTILVLPLLHDLLRSGFRWIARRLILPSSIPQDEKTAILRHKIREEIISQYPGKFQPKRLITPDGAELDAMLYIPRNLVACKCDTLLIFVDGQAGLYEYGLESQVSQAEALNVPLLVFNPRGAGESRGAATPEGLALDVYTAYHYAIDGLGVSPSRILMHGRSLGGAYGNLGAALIQSEFPQEAISVINDRSFSDLDTETRHLLKNGIIASLACKILRWTGWTMESHTAMQTLRGKKLVMQVENGDRVIPPAASMLKASVAADEEVTPLSMPGLVGEDNHNRCLTAKEQEKMEKFMREIFYPQSAKALSMVATSRPLGGNR